MSTSSTNSDTFVIRLRSPNIPDLPAVLSISRDARVLELKNLALPSVDAKLVRVIFQGKLIPDHGLLATLLQEIEESERVIHFVLKPNVRLPPSQSSSQPSEVPSSSSSVTSSSPPPNDLSSSSSSLSSSFSTPPPPTSSTPSVTASSPSQPGPIEVSSTAFPSSPSLSSPTLNGVPVEEVLRQYPAYVYILINGKPYLALNADAMPSPLPPSSNPPGLTTSSSSSSTTTPSTTTRSPDIATPRETPAPPPPPQPQFQPQVQPQAQPQAQPQEQRLGFLDAFFNLGDILQAAVIFFALSNGASWPKLLFLHLAACLIFLYRTGRLRMDIRVHRRHLNGAAGNQDRTEGNDTSDNGPPQPPPPVWRQALTGFFTSLLPGQGDGFDPAVAAAMAADDAAVAGAGDGAANNGLF
ncbi:MAG: hypothetical protein DHS80DRAFT_21379 [Piptocephalis tieghemiana]|nr:MAG: hypothetical protein DHS80DRAFT_21379 [Piptocephalis tieghemiana]